MLLAPLAIFAQFQAFFVYLFILLRKIINSLAGAAFKLNQFFFILCGHIFTKLIIKSMCIKIIKIKILCPHQLS